MPTPWIVLSALLAAAGAANRSSEPPDLQPIACDACDGWNQPRIPFLLHGRSYYVGTKGLSSVVVDTGGGLVLLDGALPQSVPHIVENLRSLGLRIADVKLILMSHAHFDHVGGIAALARLSGARVVASPAAAAALRAGRVLPDDPQHPSVPFPPVRNVVASDGAPVRVGQVTFTMHATPGHTPGGSTWTWKSCDRGGCVNMVYADSLNPLSSAPGYRFSDDAARLSRFRSSIATVRSLPCDVLVSVHPEMSGLFERQARRGAAARLDPLIDPEACRRYADDAAKALDRRVSEEQRR